MHIARSIFSKIQPRLTSHAVSSTIPTDENVATRRRSSIDETCRKRLKRNEKTNKNEKRFKAFPCLASVDYFDKMKKKSSRLFRYCPEHTRKAQIARIKSTAKNSLPESAETLLLSLSHYVEVEDSEDTEEDEIKGQVKCLDPFSKF